MLDSPRLRRARDLFEQVIELDTASRLDALRQACPDDEEVSAYVRRLLAADARASALDTSPAAGVVAILEHALQDDVPPARMGPFRVIRELGRGGMGIVYEAEQDVPRRRVALKTIHPLDRGTRARELFATEIEAMGRVLHPGIPQVHQVLEHDGRPVLAMELVEGRPLLDAAAGLDLAARARLLAAIADAVDHAHGQGVVHRDLKPANVLVTAQGQPKVLDFGVAALGEADPRGAGTLAYMAPEQLRGGAADVRSDVYGLGAIGWQLFTGRPPVDVDGLPTDRVAARKQVPGRAPRELPRPLRAVLERAIAADPSRRYATAAALADDLRRFAAHRPVAALDGSPTAFVAAFLRRYRVRLALGAGVAAGAAAGMSAWVRAGESAERAAADQDAARELDALLADATRLGDAHPDVLAAFDAFVGDPAHLETPAWSRAWLWRGRHAADAATARRALAAAWAGATDDAVGRDALLALADHLSAEADWAALEGVLGLLPDDAAADARRSLALARWDVPGARAGADAEVGPLLDLLATARPDPVGAEDGAVGDDGTRVVASGEQAVALAPDGAVLGRWPRPPGGPLAVGDGASWWADHRAEGGAVLRLDLRPGAVAVDVETTPAPVSGVRVGDADHDGVAERYTALGPQGGRIVVASPPDAPSRTLHAPTDAGNALPMGLRLADLDGDGRDELLAARRGWRGQDLRVLAGVPASPRLAGRLRMSPHDVAATRDAAGATEVLAVGHGDDVLPVLPVGHAPGAGLLVRAALGPDGLAVREARELPVIPMRVQAGDVDGDGLEDVIASGGDLVLLRRLPGDRFATVRVPGLEVLGVVQADDDAALEPWVRGRGGSWLLGAGGSGLPVRALLDRASPAAVPDGVRGPAQVAWSRAEALVAAGLPREAAGGFEDLGRRAGPVGSEALARAVALLAPIDADAAARVASRLLRRDGLSQAARATAHEALAAVQLDVDGPGIDLLDQVVALAPEAVRRDGAAWIVDLHAGRGDALAVPLAWDGDRLDVDLGLELLDEDWAVGFDLEVATPGGPIRAALMRGGGGPPDQHGTALHCEPASGGREVMVPAPMALGPHRVRLSWRASTGLLRCALDGRGKTLRPAAPPRAGEATLVVRPRVGQDELRGRVLLRVTSLDVAGARPGPRVASAPVADTPLVATLASTRLGRPSLSPDLAPADVLFLLRADPATWAGRLRTALGPAFADRFVEAWGIGLHFRTDEVRDALRLPALDGVDPGSPSGRDLLRARALALLDRGDAAEAARTLAGAAGWSGTGEDAVATWVLVARARERLGDLDGARDALARAAAADGPDGVGLYAAEDDPRLAPLLPGRPSPRVRDPVSGER